ncbi:hypothetical protein O0L34_g19201 [Tuta absoluta]|nr:hypothetical protein O0L34_g19201 [Tuta absoluta]
MAPMSNAEGQRKYREKIKQDAEKYEEKKKKHREYMKAARKPIAELSEKEKEKKRREWRLAKKKQKEGGVTKPKNNKCCALNARLCVKLKKRITDQKKLIDNILLQKRTLQNLYTFIDIKLKLKSCAN